jgi:hypothetical protein
VLSSRDDGTSPALPENGQHTDYTSLFRPVLSEFPEAQSFLHDVLLEAQEIGFETLDVREFESYLKICLNDLSRRWVDN